MWHVRLGFVVLGKAAFIVLPNPGAAAPSRPQAEKDNFELVCSHGLQGRCPGML